MQHAVLCTHCRTEMQYQQVMNKSLLPAEFLCYILAMLAGGAAVLNSDSFFTVLCFVFLAVAIVLRSKNKMNVWVCPNCGYHFKAM